MFICFVTCVNAVVQNSATLVVLYTPVPFNFILSLGFSFLFNSPGYNRVGSVPVISIACPGVRGVNWRPTSLSCKRNGVFGNRGFNLRHESCDCHNLIRVSEFFLPGPIFDQVGIKLGDGVSGINASWFGKSSE